MNGQPALPQLRQIVTERFSEEELRNLCFDLNVEYTDLPGEGRAGRARELLALLKRHNRLAELIQHGRLIRPDIPWDQIPLYPEQSPTPPISQSPISTLQSPPPPPTTLDLTGTWRDPLGTIFQITRQGDTYHFVANNPLNRLISQGTGTLVGNRFLSNFQTNIPSIGRGEGIVSDDGRQIIGSYFDSALGHYTLTLTR